MGVVARGGAFIGALAGQIDQREAPMIDLRAFAGDRYRISLDESADPSRESRLWYCRIPCRYGFINVHGPTTLAAYTDRRRMVPKLVAVEGVTVHQRGDSEVRVILDPSRLDAIADLHHAKRRRRLSDAERARLVEMTRSFNEKRPPSDPKDASAGSGSS
jgi:hypothetical protein